MAHEPQRPDASVSHGHSSSKGRGAGQAVVELVSVERGGLVFWSRQRFDIGIELQVRMLREGLPEGFIQMEVPEGDSEWMTIRGFVVACRGVRRDDGSHGFRVSLLLDPMARIGGRADGPCCPRLVGGGVLGKRFGLN